MKNLTAALCLAIAVLLGSGGMSWGAERDFSMDVIYSKRDASYAAGEYADQIRDSLDIDHVLAVGGSDSVAGAFCYAVVISIE
jgi:hypothetical protein